MSFPHPQSELEPYHGLAAFAGDIHNHCGISYGHGSIEDAYANAALQLDFASVTGHAAWHDMPHEPPEVAAYHREGFARLRANWDHVQDVTEAVNVPGEFVTFQSFEWHSMAYGDHCVYYNSGRGPLNISRANSVAELRGFLRQLKFEGISSMLLPHHVGYPAGYRGANWDSFTAEFTPVVEICSMHGCGLSDLDPAPYLHTMGPRVAASTAVTGLRRGNRFGFIGSTDHHSAHPGSYGYGRAMVWADRLDRDALWQAIQQRRTYCVTGARIGLAFTLDGAPMGAEIRSSGNRSLAVDVDGTAGIDTVEILRNGQVIAKHCPRGGGFAAGGLWNVVVAMGWGKRDQRQRWDVTIRVEGGRIHAVEPRLRGVDVVAPASGELGPYRLSAWHQVDNHTVRVNTTTYGNPNVRTDALQRMAIEVEGDVSTRVVVQGNGVKLVRTLGELATGQVAAFTGGFVSSALAIERAWPRAAVATHWQISDAGTEASEDWYFVRVRQVDDQWAFSSPIWAARE